MNIKNYYYEAEYASDVMSTIPHGYIDKTICGCGLTTIALENDENVIIAVPSIGLITNKIDQYPNQRCSHKILGVWGSTSDQDVHTYCSGRHTKKIIVTYNSLYRVSFMLDKCRLIIDESNELLRIGTSFPKEVDLVYELAKKYRSTVSFISATPIKLQYLPKWISEIDQVKINWKNTVKARPIIMQRTYPYKALREEILVLLKDGDVTIGSKTFSKVIIFINSVDKIINSIKESGIDKEQCSIICGDTLKNDTSISGIKRYSPKDKFPKYLFITKSGFSGIDLYSEDAMTIIVSNTSKSWQMIDLYTDLKQAISRQRLKSNPNYGSYIYLFNQSLFSKSEEELITDLEGIRDKIILNIPHYEYLKSIGKEKYFMKDKDFIEYTLFKNNTYVLNSNRFNADKYFILETRNQYTKGFDIRGEESSEVEEYVKAVDIKKKGSSYADLVTYFNINKDNLNWDLVDGKQEWKDVIEKSYALYNTTWKNYTIAKSMVQNYINSFDIVKNKISNAFLKGKNYSTLEIKEILQNIYKQNNINRSAKISDLSEVLTIKKIRVSNKWIIRII